ncbi:M28 family peptidase [Microbulbifer elongatus]|uniref:M28 family peptidase n=1 Tax=Microbulbifer elongatus TaxID=86173 RepID=UPI001CFCA958|nr:M28 family peptidase [Microbulbifer elongatus]
MDFFRVLAVTMFSPCIALAAVDSATDDSARRIEADVRYLASDLLEGREAGTRGYDLAAAYVAERFRAIGLKPGVGESYFQPVPLLEYRTAEGTQGSLTITRDGQVVELLSEVDYAVTPTAANWDVDVEGELVFVGYGVESPFFGRNDFAAIDLEGKIAVFLISNDPSLPSEEAAHFRRMKTASASQHGAVATIDLYTPEFEAIYAYEKLARNIKTDSRMRWRNEGDEPYLDAPNILARAVLSQAATKKLFPYGDLGWESLLGKIESGGVPSFSMGLTAQLKIQSKQKNLISHNVVAVLPGSDPELKHEYVLVTGHLDHEGIKRGGTDGADHIYNGAMDNAVGIASMLEVAAQMVKQPPKRSVIFLALTAEEKGLIGSDYYAQNPTVPKREIVANINLDMPILTYDFEDVVAFGAAHSNLQEMAAGVMDELGVRLVPDPAPERAIFVRSDQYSFVKQGVPAIYLSPGPGGDGKEAKDKFLGEHYHEPSDEWGHIRYPVAAKFARVNIAVTSAVANAGERPYWNEGDFFGVTFTGEASAP